MSQHALADLLRSDWRWIRVFALCIGWGQERLTRELMARFGTTSGRKLASRADEVVAFLDGRGLIGAIDDAAVHDWTFGDVLVERYGARARAGRAVGSGRSLETVVEAVVQDLGLPYVMRTRFTGSAGQTAPCDIAIPAGSSEAMIVRAVKGFDSTGSKLSDAVREVTAMAGVRLPRQYVFAVFDGIGWLGRQADLRRVVDLANRREIDGLFTRSTLDSFRESLVLAARRCGLEPSTK